MSTLEKALAIISIILAIGWGSTIYYYTAIYRPTPTIITITLETKAGLWADFIRRMEVIPKFEDRMWNEKGVLVRVRMITAPHRGYADKVIADFAAGVAGDVVWMKSDPLPEMVESGWLLDLTPYVQKWDDWSQFYPSMQELGTYNGKVYAIWVETAPQVVYYRKDLFKAAGLPVPWQPKNWDDIIEAARTIKERLPEVDVPLYAINPVLAAIGAGEKIYDPEDGKFIVKSERLLEVFKFFYDASIKYSVTPPAVKLEKWDTRKLFQDGELAILVDGTWCWSEKWGPGMPYEIKNREEVVGYAHFPSSGKPGAPQYATYTGGYGYMINSKTKHPDLAWELLKDLVAPDIAAEWNYPTSHLACRKDAVIGKYAEDEFLKWATTTLEYSSLLPRVEGFSTWKKLLDDVIKDYLLAQGTTPEECMNIFAEKAKEELGADRVKALPPYSL